MSGNESIKNRSVLNEGAREPQLLLDGRFQDVESWAEAADWDLSFRQLSPGPLDARVRVLAGDRCIAMRAELNQAFHQIGSPVPGYLSFGLPDPDAGDFRWCGEEAKGGEILNFNLESGFEGTNVRGFSGVALSFRRSALEDLAEVSGLPVDLAAFGTGRAVLPTSPKETAPLRKQLAAAFDTTVRNGVAGGQAAATLFHTDAAVSLLRILSRSVKHSPVRRLPARRSAMIRALEIIESPEHFPITVERLCRLVGVSAPSLYRAFREEFGLGTKEYIRSRVLSAVRSRLVTASPETLIADVANEWGIWHMGRFAAEYRKQFGELPSATLQS